MLTQQLGLESRSLVNPFCTIKSHLFFFFGQSSKITSFNKEISWSQNSVLGVPHCAPMGLCIFIICFQSLSNCLSTYACPLEASTRYFSFLIHSICHNTLQSRYSIYVCGMNKWLSQARPPDLPSHRRSNLKGDGNYWRKYIRLLRKKQWNC